MNLKRIGLDTSKAVFILHGVDQDERTVLRRNLKRAEMEAFFAKLSSTLVALEACGGSHHWGRRLVSFGHTVRLIPPQYVKPFVRRGKNDRNDAVAKRSVSEGAVSGAGRGAISEAASQPSMPSVPVRSAEQQAAAIVLSARELLVRQRTQLVNAVRRHAAEFGIVAAKGTSQLPALLDATAAGEAVPEAEGDAELPRRASGPARRADRGAGTSDEAAAKANPVSQLLAEVPGIGPIGALSLALTIDPGRFQSGRHLAAWLGLTPKEHSTGGRQRLGGISRAGNERLRQLLVVGAMAVIRYAIAPSRSDCEAAGGGATGGPGSKTASAWLLALLERKPRKLAAVALANKMARIVSPVAEPPAASQSDRREAMAMMASGEAYRGSKGTAAAA